MKARVSMLGIMALFSAALAKNQFLSFGEYSRGFNIRESKGKGSRSGRKHGNYCNNARSGVPHQSQREKDRRVRQLAAGIIRL
jgi:hypothetical protein